MAYELIVVLYQDTDFRGQHRYLYKDTPSLSAEDFNDTASSAIVYKGPSYNQGNTVRLYHDSNYRGPFTELSPGYYRSLPNDTISSVDFLPAINGQPTFPPIGLIVTIFEHINYTGQSRTLLASEEYFISGLNFNDTVSSLKVEAGPNWNNHVANFFIDREFGGGMLQPGNFRPGTRIPDLSKSPFNFNDKMSSCRIDQI